MSVKVEKSKYKTLQSGVIDVHIDGGDQLAVVEEMLGELHQKAPSTLRNAVNATARKMRTRMAQQARKTYVTKAYDYKAEMRLRKATTGSLRATIKTAGERTPLSKHQVTPQQLAHGKGRPEHYKARTLKERQLRIMQRGDLKSFLVKFKSGHLALVQRDPTDDEEVLKKRLEKSGRKTDNHIVEKRSLSLAEMLGNYRVYGKVEPEMGDLLQEEIQRWVEKTIRRRGKL